MTTPHTLTANAPYRTGALPLPGADPARWLKASLHRALDRLAPRVEDGEVLVRMGCGRANIIGVPSQDNRIVEVAGHTRR